MSNQTQVNQVTDTPQDERMLLPPVDVTEDASGITLYADLPGVPRDKLSLQVEAQTLIIEGVLSLEIPEGMEAVHAEARRPGFRRVFTLSRELDSEQVSADFNQGVLKIRIPKASHAQQRKISVQVH